ncbi:MAG: FHA domain-containing protein [Phycisphaerae bacterium]
MDCVIKIIQGPETGQEFRCAGTETILGRGPRSHVRLASPSVSYEHAVLVRNGNEFFLENLSAGGTFVNDEKVSGRVKLRLRDMVRLGQETIARVESLPQAGVEMGRRRLLILAVAAMLVLLVVVLVTDPLSPTRGSINWQPVYAKLDEFVRQESAAGKLPPEVVLHLEQAWRLREAGDSTNANKEWIRLRVLLAGLEDKIGYQADADMYRRALGNLLSPPKNAPSPDQDQMAAALIQFVARMARGK